MNNRISVDTYEAPRSVGVRSPRKMFLGRPKSSWMAAARNSATKPPAKGCWPHQAAASPAGYHPFLDVHRSCEESYPCCNDHKR